MNSLPSSSIPPSFWHRAKHLWRHGCHPLPLSRPGLSALAQQPVAALPTGVQHAAVATNYLQLLGCLPWHTWSQRLPGHSYPGPAPGSLVPYVAAFLVKLDLGLKSMSALRYYLVANPALMWVLGFPLVPSPHFPWGFDAQASLPAPPRFSRLLRQLENQTLQTLLSASITAIRDRLPAEVSFARVISLDTKHVIAWVRENNPKAYIKEGRFDKNKQPRGDKDCRLGCKRKSNQRQKVDTPHQEGVPASQLGARFDQFYWGYASGIVVTKVPHYGEFVLAEMTQTFDKSDLSYFHPLMQKVENRLGFAPPYGALDAAFDAHYVYEYFHNAGGFAAVPRVQRGADQPRLFDERGFPLCEAGLSMPLKQTFMNRTSLVPHERGRYACPLLFPEPDGQTCPVNHKKWPKGGCITTLATSIGARIRHQLDRDSQAYKDIYRQRTASERIFSQALALGIERPKLRNQGSITNQNTLIYLLINLRALNRIAD